MTWRDYYNEYYKNKQEFIVVDPTINQNGLIYTFGSLVKGMRKQACIWVWWKDNIHNDKLKRLYTIKFILQAIENKKWMLIN